MASRMEVRKAAHGTVLNWFGTYGWITPSAPIQHVSASKKGGRIYVKKADLDGLHFLARGARVNFSVYSDGSGLGAAKVKLASAAKSFIPKAAPHKSGAAKIQKEQVSAKPANRVARPGAAAGIVKGVVKHIDKNKARAMFGAKANFGRKYISDSRFEGTVLSWHGNVGWLKTDKPIKHPHAMRRGGKLYCRLEDIAAGSSVMTKGKAVTFKVYSNVHGLAADSVVSRVAKSASAAKSFVPKAAVRKPGAAVSAKPANGVARPGAAGGIVKGVVKHIDKNKARAMFGAKAAKFGRKYISDSRFEGTVLSWHGKVGWLKTDKPIKHPHAMKRGGKLYCQLEDIAAGSSAMTKGKAVTFKVYSDVHGLGADSVVPRVAKSVTSAQNAKPAKVTQAAPKARAKCQASPPGASKPAPGTNKSAPRPNKPVVKEEITSTHNVQKNFNKAPKVGRGKPDSPKPKAPSRPPPGTRKPLPPNWEEHHSEEHDVAYFWNKVTKESSWERPR